MRSRTCLAGILVALTAALALAPQGQAYPGANGEIVYQRLYQRGSEIFSFDPATGTEDRLTSAKIKSGRSISASHPAYSADGRRIVFSNAVRRHGAGGRRSNIFVMRADGSRPRRLTRSDSHQVCPAFSPDGSTIAFFQAGDIWTMDPDGTERRNLTAGLPNGGGCPVFSPDGTKIAYDGYDGDDGDIIVMDADGTDPVNLTPASSFHESQPAFSPDGSRIAFVSYALDFRGDLMIMDADGTNVQPVTTAGTGLEHYDPAFSPDGTQLVYTGRRSSRAAIDVFSVPVSGGAGAPIPGLGGVAQNPDWGVAVP